MNLEIRSSFEKDIKKIKDKALKQRIKKAILKIQDAKKLGDIGDITKMGGAENAYRLRIGDYRIGFYYLNKTVVLARFKGRKELYQYFPPK
jgi:mRNA interferase RelE/StbE